MELGPGDGHPPQPLTIQDRVSRLERIINGVPEEDQPGLRLRLRNVESVVEAYVALKLGERLQKVEITAEEIRTAKLLVRGALIYIALTTIGTGAALYQIAKTIGVVP